MKRFVIELILTILNILLSIWLAHSCINIHWTFSVVIFIVAYTTIDKLIVKLFE